MMNEWAGEMIQKASRHSSHKHHWLVDVCNIVTEAKMFSFAFIERYIFLKAKAGKSATAASI